MCHGRLAQQQEKKKNYMKFLKVGLEDPKTLLECSAVDFS